MMPRLGALVGLLVSVVVAVPVAARQPLPLENHPLPPDPTVSATAWIVYDETYDQVLGSLDADVGRAMASTTKMMTAIVAMEQADLDDRVLISEVAAAVGEAEIGLVPGERIPLRDLVASLLLQSANDAAIAIAEHVAGDVPSFVDLMNAKADELGLIDTNFVNPHGLDAPGHRASAVDLLKIAEYGMAIPEFAELVATRTYSMPPTPDGVERTARSTNELVATYDGAFGVKTGYTDQAGLTLVAGADRESRRVYVVVMDSDDHFADAATLLNWAFEEFALLTVVTHDQVFGTIRTPGGTVDAVADETIDVFGPTAQAEAVVITPNLEEGAPTVVAALGDDVLGTSPLHADPVTPLPGLGEALGWASRYWDWLWGND